MPLLARGAIATLLVALIVRKLGHAVAIPVVVPLLVSEPYGSIVIKQRVLAVHLLVAEIHHKAVALG